MQALRGVDFRALDGEITGLVGDNGAGKSTLIKILSGAMHADTGEVRFAGEPIHWRSPAEALNVGIETVYQDFSLAPQMDIVSNLFLGREIRRRGWLGRIGILDRPTMRTQAKASMRSIGITTLQSIRQPVETLSGGQRQALAIARAGIWGTRLLIMDEPIAALGVRQTAIVERLIRDAKGRGLSIIVISHNIPEMLGLCDRVVVMRAGRVVAELEAKSTSVSEVVTLMVGMPREDVTGPASIVEVG
jgi:ABC-type sugar transport system ATPase subunit